MIEIKSLSVEKSNKTILNNISLNFYPNRFHMIVGPNGAGKLIFLELFALENINTEASNY